MKYTDKQALNIVDRIFNAFASNCRMSAKKNALAILKGTQPEPPTLRPMSELPKEDTFDFLARIERKDNGFKFHECMERNNYLIQGSHRDFAFFKSENYENEEFKVIGWLYELPNPNEIKLPC